MCVKGVTGGSPCFYQEKGSTRDGSVWRASCGVCVCGQGLSRAHATGTLHAHPGKAAGEVENGFGRGFAHAVPLDDPLKGAELEVLESGPVTNLA